MARAKAVSGSGYVEKCPCCSNRRQAFVSAVHSGAGALESAGERKVSREEAGRGGKPRFFT